MRVPWSGRGYGLRRPTPTDPTRRRFVSLSDQEIPFVAKFKLMLGRLSDSGRIRQEVATFLRMASLEVARDGRFEDLVDCPIARVPTPVARNLLIKTARDNGVDILFQIDDDMGVPPDFFMAATNFLLEQPGAAAIGVPYCTAPPREDVTVFEWASGQTGSPDAPFALTNIVREDAARRKGIERVANLGTGCVAYKLSCFNAITPPYFDYSYEDKEHTKVIETEDCFAHRRLMMAGVPLYVHWDFWANHYKSKVVVKPVPINDSAINNVFMEHARAEVRQGGKELASLVPGDVHGWCDFAEVYDRAVKDAPNGARFVEVGSWHGQSAILMARLIQRSRKNIRFTCVDHFQGSVEHHNEADLDCSDVRAKFEANLERYGVAHSIQVLPLASVEAAKTFADDSLDFVFLDASHDEDAVREDIAAWLPKVRLGGCLAGHDFNFFGVSRAVAAMIPDKGVDIIGRSWVYRKEQKTKQMECSRVNGCAVEMAKGS